MNGKYHIVSQRGHCLIKPWGLWGMGASLILGAISGQLNWMLMMAVFGFLAAVCGLIVVGHDDSQS